MRIPIGLWTYGDKMHELFWHIDMSNHLCLRCDLKDRYENGDQEGDKCGIDNEEFNWNFATYV